MDILFTNLLAEYDEVDDDGEDTAYLPDEELDQTSKVHYVDWIPIFLAWKSRLSAIERTATCPHRS